MSRAADPHAGRETALFSDLTAAIYRMRLGHTTELSAEFLTHSGLSQMVASFHAPTLASAAHAVSRNETGSLR